MFVECKASHRHDDKWVPDSYSTLERKEHAPKVTKPECKEQIMIHANEPEVRCTWMQAVRYYPKGRVPLKQEAVTKTSVLCE